MQCPVEITGQTSQKRLLFEWHLQKLPCIEWYTPSPYLLGDPISRSSNRWLCLWLQASVIAEACDINGSSPWEFFNTFNHSPHSHTFMKGWQYKHAEKNCFFLEVKCVYNGNICNVCFHPQRHKRWATSALWPNRLRNPSFFDSPLKWSDPLWIARSTRWLFPWGKDFLSLRDTWGILSHYLHSGQMITFKSLSEEYSWIHNHLG